MSHEDVLREQILKLLEGGGAHAPVEEALGGWPVALRGKKPDGQPHTAWRLLEHMRISQRDILDFCREEGYESPPWPAGYWPKEDAPPSEGAWENSIAAFRADLEAMQALVADTKNDLLGPVVGSESATLLREALLVADHNAYHQGQVVLLRRLLGLPALATGR